MFSYTFTIFNTILLCAETLCDFGNKDNVAVASPCNVPGSGVISPDCNPKTTTSFPVTHSEEKDLTNWCYSDNSCNENGGGWKGPGSSCNMKGLHQSPVNLVVGKNQARQKQISMIFSGYFSYPFYITNDGHTVKVAFNSDETSNAELTIGDFPDSRTYRFAQLHFHWGNDTRHGSEHQVDSVQYSMEAHFVHYSSDYNCFNEAVASNKSDAIAVIGVFLNADHVSKNDANENLSKIAKNIPTYRKKGDQADQCVVDGKEYIEISNPIDLEAFLPSRGEKVFQYEGSLTTPPCSEVVYWTVKQNPIKVSSENINKFLGMKGKNGETYGLNYRSVAQRKLQLPLFTVV